MEGTPDTDISLFIDVRMSFDVESERMQPRKKDARASLNCLCKARPEINSQKRSRRMDPRNMLGTFPLRLETTG